MTQVCCKKEKRRSPFQHVLHWMCSWFSIQSQRTFWTLVCKPRLSHPNIRANQLQVSSSVHWREPLTPWWATMTCSCVMCVACFLQPATMVCSVDTFTYTTIQRWRGWRMCRGCWSGPEDRVKNLKSCLWEMTQNLRKMIDLVRWHHNSHCEALFSTLFALKNSHPFIDFIYDENVMLQTMMTLINIQWYVSKNDLSFQSVALVKPCVVYRRFDKKQNFTLVDYHCDINWVKTVLAYNNFINRNVRYLLLCVKKYLNKIILKIFVI